MSYETQQGFLLKLRGFAGILRFLDAAGPKRWVDLHTFAFLLLVPFGVFSGLLFGLGWGLVGACPGPIFVLAGQGYGPALVLLGLWRVEGQAAALRRRERSKKSQ